ncbi:hypothetical protein [Muricoccus radiodurans]|uniref:hypothetical protein n=1 Tax=Muricoccus radiodurans TaxID=2231721 RepID=UPI003CF928AB
MPRPNRRSLLGGALLALAAIGPAARAQDAVPTRLRGTIVGLEGNALTVNLRAGGTARVMLAEALTVASLRRVALADLAPGTSVGAVAEPGPDGALRAVAITVLPPGQRITELQVPWDTGQDSSMNNGPIGAVVENAGGRELTLSILGRSVRLLVSPDTPLLQPVPASRADLVPGRAVFINGTRAADGQVSATRVTVEKDGVAPVI